ncbi:class II fructose-bisphosphate aldolase [Olsenella sp. YH-ols2217]|uniref:Class II fructose-bisphosphate aldolase n=1 Tax=Kribbibacterium absianum TaxID=3044210 RepID=A0ABT6ZK17_9ACTN|nr:MULTISPECIES: class II fructose-bisphosphate aldolase [unclassified Olsenella]MDJ1121506.1 class II fructose-bisphosphate aldolase [Olsenella sp. YH-ols2216]MDJ1128996.1 class II fructose-bisphosphate aldolase [Olsenella sp. YH-ols2217]
MLVNLTDILAVASQRNMAVAAFNCPNFEMLRAAVDAAEGTGFPVIVAHAQSHEAFVPIEQIGPAMLELADASSAMVCVHLDHGEDLGLVRRALDLGFTGAMYDGSTLPYEQNVANSLRARAMCDEFDAGLECEIGSMGASEGGAGQLAHETAAVYTDPAEAARFIADTQCDALACSFGTVHGLYKGEPHLSFDVLREIRELSGLPLVMHGGSGVSDADYHAAIDAGIRKINYYTYGSKYAGEAATAVIDAARDEGRPVFWDDLCAAAYDRLLAEASRVITTFANDAKPVMRPRG